jgi:hypothetical protein
VVDAGLGDDARSTQDRGIRAIGGDQLREQVEALVR